MKEIWKIIAEDPKSFIIDLISFLLFFASMIVIYCVLALCLPA